jgi:hypothetical protein
MDVRRAMTFAFGDPRWFAKLGRAGMVALIPLIGSVLILPAFALAAIRAAANGDERTELADCRMDAATLVIGLKCQVLTMICGLAAGLLTFPLWGIDSSMSTSPSATADMAPALVGALQGPSLLLTTVVTAVLSAVGLARFAVTGSARAALDVAAIWSHLRAEPAIWIAAAVVGFTIEQAPVTLAWLLPASMQLPAMLIAIAVFWPFALLVQAHLIGQAHRWSAQTLARRRPLIVRVRW